MRLVCTGAKGFIGSVFCKRALELGHEVFALDDCSRGLNDISFLGDRFLRHDCLTGINEAVYQIAGTKVSVDAVVHLAAGTGDLTRSMDELMVLNVEMMKRVYMDALSLGAKAFLWPTTSLALGVPDSTYVQSKEEGLKELLGIDREKGISVALRFFNVCGSYAGLSEFRKHEVHLIWRMAEAYVTQQRLESEGKTFVPPFVVNGDDYSTRDGSPSRDFVNVLDVVEYLLHLIRLKVGGCDTQDKAHADGAVWLGTGKLTTVWEAVNIFEQYVGPLVTAGGPRRSFDCGALHVDPQQQECFEYARGGMLIPPHISIRDEAITLVNHLEKQCRCENPILSARCATCGKLP